MRFVTGALTLSASCAMASDQYCVRAGSECGLAVCRTRGQARRGAALRDPRGRTAVACNTGLDGRPRETVFRRHPGPVRDPGSLAYLLRAGDEEAAIPLDLQGHHDAHGQGRPLLSVHRTEGRPLACGPDWPVSPMDRESQRTRRPTLRRGVGLPLCLRSWLRPGGHPYGWGGDLVCHLDADVRQEERHHLLRPGPHGDGGRGQVGAGSLAGGGQRADRGSPLAGNAYIEGSL